MTEYTVPKPGEFRVSVMKTPVLTYAENWLECFIVGDKHEERMFADFLIKGHCSKAGSIEEADLVIFTGGVDVNPALYGHDILQVTDTPDNARDTADILVYAKCLELGIPMMGVCRGAQFLHVMNGGTLFQHVDYHNTAHSMYDLKTKKVLKRVSSVHHQMCQPNEAGGMEVLADATVSRNRMAGGNTGTSSTKAIGQSLDIEAFFYRDTVCLGVQGHPEYRGYDEYSQWTHQKMYEYVVENPDIELRGRYRRLKQEIIDRRDKKSVILLEDKRKELN